MTPDQLKSQPPVYLNGEFLPIEQARVSVMDRGFLFGDGVYEVIPVYGGRLFRFAEHLRRLEESLRGIRLDNPLSDRGWLEMLERLAAQRPGADQSLYLQVTRGAAPVRDHAIPPGIAPTLFAMGLPMAPVNPRYREQGVAAITIDDIRWRLCNIKAITLLANVLARQQAIDHDAVEAILVRDGFATEGAATNLFIVSGGRLLTPPKSEHLLPGITRDLVLELAARHGIPHAEQPISANQLFHADELWITSSTKEILPVTRLNGDPLGDGVPGPLYRRMIDLYGEYVNQIRIGGQE